MGHGEERNQRHEDGMDTTYALVMLADVAEKNLMGEVDGEDGKVGFADGRKGRLVVVDEEKPLEKRRGLTRRGLRILTELIVRNENEGQLLGPIRLALGTQVIPL
jgi:hypothetical protein